MSSVQDDFFASRFPHSAASSEELTAHERLVHKKKRFCMTAKYVYARNRALLDSSLREDILSWAGLAPDRESIRELSLGGRSLLQAFVVWWFGRCVECVLFRPVAVGTGPPGEMGGRGTKNFG